MKKKVFFSMAMVLIMFLSIKYHKQDRHDYDILLENVEALAGGEISFDFCIHEPGICTYYENGFVIKGTLQYTGQV